MSTKHFFSYMGTEPGGGGGRLKYKNAQMCVGV